MPGQVAAKPTVKATDPTAAVAAPVLSPALPVPARANGGMSVPVIVLIAAALGGGALLLGVVGLIAFLLMSPSDDAGHAPGDAIAANAPAAPPPPPVANSPPAPEPTATPVAPTPPPANITWVGYEDMSKGFKADFPGGQPQPVDPLGELTDETQRELAAAMMKEWTVLGVTHAGRKFTLTAAPLKLGGVPPEAYLDRMSAGLGVIHQGFTVIPQPPADRSLPVRDYVMKKDDAGKLLRVVVGDGHVYQLLIEGEAGLSLGDPVATEFFQRFECSGPASSAVASAAPSQPRSEPDPESKSKSKTKSKSKSRPELASVVAAVAEPDSVDWQPLTGKKYAFKIHFPGVAPEEEDPLAAVPEASRAKLQKSWNDLGFAAEAFAASAGDRHYAVAVFRTSRPPKANSNPVGQLDSIGRTYTMEIYDKVRGRGFSTGAPKVQWQQWTTTTQTIKGDRKVVIRRAVLEPYVFVARVEGPATMDDMDPQVHKFFDSLKPPVDAAAPPAE